MYSDAYVKRYKAFMSLLTAVQKPKDVERFIILAKACLICNAYEEAKDFNKRVYDFLIKDE